MSIPKQGDTVYVFATCKDTLKRGSGVCYFQEFGGCPYIEGRVNYCGEREDVPGIFESVVEMIDETAQSMTLRGMSFGSVSDFRISLCHWENIAFATRKEAEAALEQWKAERESQEKRRFSALFKQSSNFATRQIANIAISIIRRFVRTAITRSVACSGV